MRPPPATPFLTRGEALEWAGFPVRGRITIGETFAVYCAIQKEAASLWWPWQIQRRRDLKYYALEQLSGCFEEVDRERRDYVPLSLYPQTAEPLVSKWNAVRAESSASWAKSRRSDFSPDDYEKIR